MLCDYTAGLFAGLVSIFVGYPFDTIKIQQQVRSLTVREATRRITVHRGWRGFYRGLTAPIVTNGILNASFFGIYGDLRDYLVASKLQTASYQQFQDRVRSQVGLQDPKHIRKATVGDIFISGTVAGLLTTIAAAPIELVKTKLQSQMKRTMFTGPRDCIKIIIKEAGIRGLFRGFYPLLLRDGPGGGAFVVAYELIKENMGKYYGPTSRVTENIIAGGLAGMSNWFLVLPFDSIKTRMQADDHIKPHYKSMLHTATDIWKTDGITGLYRGLWSVSIRAFPVNATIFLVYDYVQHILCDRQ